MKGNTCVSNTLEKVENLIRISSSGYEKKKKKKKKRIRCRRGDINYRDLISFLIRVGGTYEFYPWVTYAN